MQDELYPPGMAPKGGKPVAQQPQAKPQPRPAKPSSGKAASLPPAAAEVAQLPEEFNADLGELLPGSAALPPEAEVAAHLRSPIAAAGPTQLKVSTAPSAARVSKQRDRQATRFMALTVFGSAALVTILGVGYFHINPPNRTIAKLNPPPVRMERPSPNPNSARQKPARRTTAASPPQEVPPIVWSNEPAIENVSPAESLATTAPDPIPVAPAPESATPEPAPPVAVTRAEVEPLIKALAAAKTAPGEANYKAAQSDLATAESLAKLPKHQATVARLKEISGLVQRFHEGVQSAAKAMQAGETFKVGNSTQVTFVEAKPDKIILRIAGMNKTYPFNDLPAGLALALAEFKLPATDPTSSVIKGAYLLVHKRADSETHEKAASLWQQAQSGGIDLTHLLPFVTESYIELRNDASDAM